MAINKDNSKALYDAISSEFENIGTYEEFEKKIANKDNRKSLYDAVSSHFENIGTFDEFNARLWNDTPKPPLQRSHEEDAPIETAAMESQSQVKASVPKTQADASKQEQQEQVQLQPQQKESQSQEYYRPSEAELSRLHTSLSDFERQNQEATEQVKRAQESLTEEGRKKQKALEVDARRHGVSTGPVFGVAHQANAADESAAQQQQNAPQQHNTISAVPYGAIYKDGQWQTQWKMPDGSLTTDFMRVSNNEADAGRNRMAKDFLRKNGDQLREIYGRDVTLDEVAAYREDFQKELENRASLQSAIDEQWKNAEAEYEKYKNGDGGFWDKTKNVVKNVVDQYAGGQFEAYDEFKKNTIFNFDKFADNAYNSLSSEYKQSLIDDSKSEIIRQCKENKTEIPQNIDDLAEQAARNYVYRNVNDYAIKKLKPKSTGEYILRLTQDNVVRTLDKAVAAYLADSYGLNIAEMQANDLYGEDHTISRVVGTVLGMAADPLTYISGGTASVAAKGAQKIGTRVAQNWLLKGVEHSAASRLLASKLSGRIATGAVAGGVNFAMFEGVGNAAQQLKTGGEIDPETGKGKGFSVGDVASSAAHGFVMGSVTGVVSPVLGNYADKLTKATESTAGKMAVRGGEIATSTVLEGTIFSVPEWIDGERNAWDVWTDNTAMMLGFKAQGLFKSTVSVLKEMKATAKEKRGLSFTEKFRKRLDASPADFALTKEEIQELKENGYNVESLLTKKENKQQEKKEAKVVIGEKEQTIELEEVGGEQPRDKNLDGFDMMIDLMQNKDVSEATRAKMYYFATGRYLPASSIVGCDMIANPDGTYTVISKSVMGDVITKKTYKNKDKAQYAVDELLHVMEINSISVGEQAKSVKIDEITNRQKVNVGFSDETVENLRPERAKERIKQETGVNIDEALKKPRKKRTDAEQQAVEQYAKEVFAKVTEPEKRSDRLLTDDGNTQRLLESSPDDGQPQGPTDEAYEEGRTMADDANVKLQDLILQAQDARKAYIELLRDYSADENYLYDVYKENPLDLLTSGREFTEEQQQIILDYASQKARIDGYIDAVNESNDVKKQEIVESVKKRTSKQGNVKPLTLKVDAKRVYLIDGELTVLEDGTIDASNSSKQLVVYDDESGKYRIISPNEVFKTEAEISPDEMRDTALKELDAEQQLKSEEVTAATEKFLSADSEEERRAEEEARKAYEAKIADEDRQKRITVTAEYESEDGSAKKEEIVIDGKRKATVITEGLNNENGEIKTTVAIEGQEFNSLDDALKYVDENPLIAEYIPRNEAGEPDFEAVEPTKAADGLIEFSGNSVESARNIADAQVAQAKAELDELAKKAPMKGKVKLSGSPIAMIKQQKQADEIYKQQKAEHDQQLEAAQNRYAHWQSIQTEIKARQESARHEQALAEDAERKRKKAELKAEQERTGANNVGEKVKQKWNDAPKIEGHSDEITLADGTKVKGKYVLVEAGSASASHDPNNAFAPTEGFPIAENGQSVNDRDYSRDKDAQRAVNEIASNYDNRALQSPVVVSKDGVVLSGNNRTMSGDIAAANGTDKAYVEYLREYGSKYGFSKDQLANMQHPRVVFVPDEDMPYDATTFAKFNAQETKLQSKPEQAVKLGKIVSNDAYGRVIRTISEYDNLNDFYADDEATSAVLGMLAQEGVINERQMPSLRTGTTISNAGKELIENVLIGKAFEDAPDAVRELIEFPNLRQSVVMGLTEIGHNVTLGEYGLHDELAKAIDLCYRAKKAQGDVFKQGNPVSPFGLQQGLFDDEFGESQVKDATILMLADLLNSKSPSELKLVLAEYNREAALAHEGQMDIFTQDVPTKERIIKSIIDNYKNESKKQQRERLNAAVADRKQRVAKSKGEEQGSGDEQTPDAGEGSAEGEGVEGKVETGESHDKVEEENDFTITPAQYTTKRGKVLDMHLVKFNKELSKEQQRALTAVAKELKGWYDKNQGGFMMRTEEDAKKLTETINNEESVADAQPLTAQELRDAVEPKTSDKPKTVKTPKPKPANEVEITEPKEEPVKEDKPKYEVSDEELKDLLGGIRDILGIGDDEGDAGLRFRDPDELTAEQRQKLMSIGLRAAMAFVERGNESFADYASMMVRTLGDKVRPWLKAFYGGLEYVPGYEKYSLSSHDEVRDFDVENFDKPQKDVLAQAETIAAEHKAQKVADKATNELKTKRNEQRREAEKQTSADTDAITTEAETVASEAETVAKTSTDEEKLNEAHEKVDNTLGKVNNQLAVLGYYEADYVDKDYNEAYGYMRNAEKKAVKDASNLANNLIDDLGLDRYAATHSQSLKGGTMKKKPLAVANIAPAGGDIAIHLPLTDGRELSIYISLEPVLGKGVKARGGDNLEVSGIMYRLESPNGNGKRYGYNNFASSDVTYSELLNSIKRVVKDYLPESSHAKGEDYKVGDKVQYSADGGKTWSDATIIEISGKDDVVLDTGFAPMMYVNAHPDQLRRENPLKKSTTDLPKPTKSVKSEQPIGDLFDGLFDDNDTNKSVTQKTKDNEKTNVQPGTEETRRGGQQQRPNEPLGESTEHEDERANRGGVAQRSGEHTMSDPERSGRVSQLPQNERNVSTSKNTHNNHAERGVDYAPKGEKARIEANIAAIELAKKLLASGSPATPEEMKVLRRYSGWGGLGAAFNEGSAWSPNPINKRLRELLTPEEYDAAVMSRNSAYYTPAYVIDTMWDIAKALGFKGGNILEGSAGIGNIIGLMPTDLSERSNIHAIEIDGTTGGILSLLYPDANVEIQGFEETRIPNGSVDLAITNVPFVTGLNVKDESGDSDLSKKFRDIHDFCIAKNVRKLREGGIGIFITSSGTLDKSQKLRNWLVGDKEGNADVVGVFRMNNQTFGGTPATSDIIVVRKRVNGRKSANAIDVSTASALRTVEYTDDKNKTKNFPLFVNRYFIEHPENMGGEMYFNFEQGVNYHPTSIGLFPTSTANQTERLTAWAQRMADMDWSKEQGTAATEQTSHINERLGEGVKEGSMVTDSEGKLCVARMGRAVPLDINNNKIKGRTKEECFKDYSEIKEALADVLKYQTEHEDDAGLQPLLDRLNTAYDTFVQRYGNLNKNNNLAWLRNDVDFSSIVALETYSEKGTKDGKKIKTYGKTDIFSRRVVEKESEPAPKNVKDGIIASIYKFGRIDSEYLAEQLGKSTSDVKKEIIDSGLGFENPTTGQLEVSYEYLSGNVREKLRQAKEANEAAGGAYTPNIKVLEAVQPLNIPAHLIEFTLGSSWIEPKLYERYIEERTGLKVELTNAGGTWSMKEPWYTDEPKNKEMGVRSEKLDIFIPGHKLIEAAITNKTITVSKTFKNYDGSTTTETDPIATTACATKVDEIRQDFKDWARAQMQADPELSIRMEEVYNDKFNNSVPKTIPDEFIPEHFGGAATTVGGKPFQLRKHQAKAVIRATTQPVLLAHEVGTGKTYTLITTAMEMRRLGTARKPMIVVQNATVGQFVASAKQLYPNAKILTIEDADRTAEGRKAFYAKIKFNDWDMIVVPQSVFERIPDSIERQTKFIQDKIEEKMLVLEKMKDADPNGKSMIVRSAEREISNLQDEIAQLANSAVTDKKKKDSKKAAVTRQNAEVRAKEMLDRETDDTDDFDSMGIDAILIDEAHEYKHLGFATAMQRGVKGVDPSFSKKSQGVFLKTQSVLEKTGGKNVVFATGTPISNTAAEIWTFMRYLMPADTMKDYDIYYFDDFVRNFGNLQQMLEFTTSGKYKENNRFAGYVNLPELVRIWSTVADTVLTREAGGVSDKIPQMEGGKAQDIFLPQTRALRSIMKYVKEQLDEYDKMSGKEKKENSHIPLVMYGIAKAAAVDARLVQSDAVDDPKSKTNEAVRQTLRSLEDTKDYKGTVAIFADNYQNKASGFNLYEDIREKLIDAGVPAEQIVIMKSGMTVNKKLEIFSRVNSGDVRVIMGSTFTLGTGVNIQERLHTLIHLDAPNRPMDYTQRNGRILRQGNLHNEWEIPVRVLRFGVEDSLDVTAYQRLKTKGAIADSIMNGKQLMNNSMENRSLEEEQDLFGDITAQLSGSEYALLKNQVEKEVRKLTAKQKNWEADQTYIHNRKRQIAGQNKNYEKQIADNKNYLAKIEAATIDNITVGKLSFPTVDSMDDFFAEQNKKKAELQEQARTNGYSSRPVTSDIVISVGGFDFKIHTEINRETKQGQQGDLFYSAPAKMTYSCSELGIENMPVKGNIIKNAVTEIMEDVVSGKDFKERIDIAERSMERNNAELQSMEAREGVPFQYSEELAKAEEKLAEYEELMKKEIKAKEAKYAEMDKDVKASSNIELTEEDSVDKINEHRATEGLEEVSEEEVALRDALNEQLKKSGIDVVTDVEDGERILAMAEDNDVKENKVYHGSGADFDEFDHSHIGEGEGAQAFGWGTYLTEVKGIGEGYAKKMAKYPQKRALKEAMREENMYEKSLISAKTELSDSKKYAEAKKQEYESLKAQAEQIKSDYGEKSVEYDNFIFDNDLDRAKRQWEIAEESAKRNETDIEHFEQKLQEAKQKVSEAQAEFDKDNAEPKSTLYTVEVPDDNGKNFLHWESQTPSETVEKIRNYVREHCSEEVAEEFDKQIAYGTDNPDLAEYGQNGENVYKALEYALHSDKKASLVLSELGMQGISYPADFMRGGRADGARNYVIFKEEDAKITDKVRFFKTKNGKAYGFTVGGKIYVDPRIAKADTPIHEYSHLWASMFRDVNPKEWSNVVKLMKDSPLWEEIRKKYPELKTDDEIADEVLAHFSGKRGAERLRQAQQEAMKEKGVSAKASAISAIERVRKALSTFWKGVCDLLHIHFTSAEEVADRVLSDMLNGVDPMKVKNEAKKEKGNLHYRDEKEVQRVNEKFNEELQMQIDGKLPENHIYKIGKPGSVLRSTGVPDLPIQMSARRLQEKATLFDHNFDLRDVKDLVQALQDPLAIFVYGDKTKAQNIIIPLQKGGKNFIVGLSLRPIVNGSHLEINSIRNVFPKDNSEWLNWINQGKALYLNKEKIQILIDQQRTNLADVDYLDLDSMAKVIENFENPKITEQKIKYRTSSEIDAEYPNWLEGTTNDNGKHTTQIAGTVKTYQKVGKWIESHLGKDVRILDASSGMGYGTADLKEQGFNIEDVEPYQSEDRKKNNPATYSSYGDIEGKYDYIISNAVLNVVPDDWRSDILHDMAARLNEGGKLFINTRKAGEEKSIKDKIELDSPQEVLVKRNGHIASYQKFFTPQELKEWAEKELGDGYTVEIANEENSGTKGLAAVVVTKTKATSATDPESKTSRATEISEHLNTPVRVITSEKEMEGLSPRQKKAKGWYNTATGEVVVVVSNNADVADVENTVLHEVIGHDGIRVLFPDEKKLNNALDEMYRVSNKGIKDKIDAETQKMYDAEVSRIMERKRKEHEANGEDANATYYTDLAEAHKEASAKREQMRRDATEEYGADLAGRIGEGGFEKMTAEEKTFWGKIKSMLQEALKRLLDGLGIKSLKKWGDKEWAYIYHEAYKRKKNGGNPTVLDLAESAAMREKTGFGKDVREENGMGEENHKEFYISDRILMDKRYKSIGLAENWLDKKGFSDNVYPLSEYLRNGGKTIKVVLKPSLKNYFKGTRTDFKSVKTDDVERTWEQMKNSGKYEWHKSPYSNSEYLIDTATGDVYRKADHWGNVASCTWTLDGKAIRANYIEPNTAIGKANISDFRYILGRSSEVIPDPKNFDYDKKISEINSEIQQIQDIIVNRHGQDGMKIALQGLRDSLQKAKERLETYQYSAAHQTPDDSNLKYRDGDDLNSIIENVKANAEQFNAESKDKLSDAVKAIGGDLRAIHKAMLAQREYDAGTVKSITDLANSLFTNGLLDGISEGDIKRLLSTAKNVTGKKDISKYVQNVMDILTTSQLREAKYRFNSLLKVKGSKVNANGVEVQGELDSDGAKVLKELKQNIGLSEKELAPKIIDALDRMGSTNQVIADNAALRYRALTLAQHYAESVIANEVEAKTLKEELEKASEDYQAGLMTKDAYDDFCNSVAESLRENKLDRIAEYNNFSDELEAMLSESISKADEWREAEKQRIADIQHNANSDMEGLPYDEHHKSTPFQKFMNNPLFQFFLQPLPTFDYMLRLFGNKDAKGEGYLWNRFMRQYNDASEKEYKGYADAIERINVKIGDIFGYGSILSINDMGTLFELDRKLPTMEVKFWDGGEMKSHTLTQGNLLYMYMVNKMSDGRMKLRRMGITEEDMDRIEKFLDPRFKEFADWVQSEFLPDLRNKYNETYKALFGTPMAEIDNYFPLKILKNALKQEVDINDPEMENPLPSTITGSVKKRTRNSAALDITNTNAFNVLLDHIKEMEHWAAFGEFNRDLNTLLSYTRFKNKVLNMTSIYGSGTKLWNNFKRVCAITSGSQQSQSVSELDKTAVNLAKGVTAAKVSLRIFTALKQFLSLPAFIADADMKTFVASLAYPPMAWNWCMKNLPIFEKRWKSRMAGDPRLLKTDVDWSVWKSKVVEQAARIGMAPNAFVDAVTVSIGTYSIYKAKLKKYLDAGFPKEYAEQKAKEDATIAFNETQQSNETAYMSPMQTARTWFSVLFTIFRNSAISYTRKLWQSIANMKNRFTGKISIDFMTKKAIREGLTEGQAKKYARSEYYKGMANDIANIAIFAYGLQFFWDIGAYTLYLLFGDDDEQKNEMINDAAIHAIYGSIEGLTAGDAISATLNEMTKGGFTKQSFENSMDKSMPLTSDLTSALGKLPTDYVAALNDLMNVAVQSGIGVNPQSLTDVVVAGIDAAGDDAEGVHEFALLLGRIFNTPQSQLDKIYFDEINASAEEASRMTPAQIAERFAEYRVMRQAPLTGFLYSEEQKRQQLDKQKNIANDRMKERLISSIDAKINPKDMKRWADEYSEVSKKMTQINGYKLSDPEEYKRQLQELVRTPEYRRYAIYGEYKKYMDQLTRLWLNSKDVEKSDEYIGKIKSLREKMAETMEKADAQ